MTVTLSLSVTYRHSDHLIKPPKAFNRSGTIIMSAPMDIDPPETSASANTDKGTVTVTSKDGKKRFEVKKVSQHNQNPCSW